MTDEIVKFERPRDPDGIYSPSMDAETGLRGAIGRRSTNMVMEKVWQAQRHHPDPAMRARGYTRNPQVCGHERKSFAPKEGWQCRDCGVRCKDGPPSKVFG